MQQQLESLLTDARETYNFRAASFNNLLTIAGIILAADGALLGLTTDFFSSESHIVSKIFYASLILLSMLLSFRVLFQIKLPVIKIDAMLDNLLATRGGSYNSWLKYSISLYDDASKRIGQLSKAYYTHLLYSVSFLLCAIIVLVLSSLIRRF